MKKYSLITAISILIIALLSSCEKDFKEKFLFTNFMLEFDDATWESPAAGKSYPVIGPYSKGSGIHKFKVNLLGAQRGSATTAHYRIVEEESSALEGVHFTLVDNEAFTIDANSSNGEITIEILDFTPSTGTVTAVFELVESEEVEVSENYKRIGISISQVGPTDNQFPLHFQIGPDTEYNSIYFDRFNPAMPSDVVSRIDQVISNFKSFGDGSRRYQTFHVTFTGDNLVTFVAIYMGGGGTTLTSTAVALWTYQFEMDEEGVGRFSFVEANGNGNNLKGVFAPILDDYIETYEFKLKWVEESIIGPPRPGVFLGGLFRTDQPTSFMIGSLEVLANSGSIKPYPQSPALHSIFDMGNEEYYSTIYIDPIDASQSTAFVDIWNQGKTYIQGLAGRQLHKMMLYFNPNFRFTDITLVMFYYSAANGKFIGQMRFSFYIDFEGVMHPLQFIYQDANGGAVRAPQLVDDFLLQKSFKLVRTGDKVKFTDQSDPTIYFEGTLSNHPIGAALFFPE